ncbi:MAG TPA: GDSL-type esterase/lipase family protein [Pseudolabrys sp.]|nr:GDSL-type esterase/lipase family protein [Pseudolabrys sp.]
MLAGSAKAEMPQECLVARPLLEENNHLAKAAAAVAAKRLNVLVLGAGSSSLPGPSGAGMAYPARLKAALQTALPGVAVTVATDVTARRTAIKMADSLAADLQRAKPDLIVWQTGTVDAMQGADPELFNQALDRGIAAARAGGADMILINAQYSPRTESMIALGTYVEVMRWVAVQHEIPMLDRFAIMKLWSDLGTFDLYSATKALDTAGQVHNCIGQLLSSLVVDAVKTEEAPKGGQ